MSGLRHAFRIVGPQLRRARPPARHRSRSRGERLGRMVLVGPHPRRPRAPRPGERAVDCARGGSHGEHVVVRLHGRGVGCRRGEEWCGKLVGGRVEGLDKMQVEDALPIDGMMLREEE